MNQVNLIGRLVRDVEVRNTNSDGIVCNGTLAVDNPYKKDEDGNNTADFIRIVAFNGTCDFLANHTQQGTRIGVTGRIQTGSYVNKEGQIVYTTDILVSNVYFADSKKEVEAPAKKPTYQKKPSNSRR